MISKKYIGNILVVGAFDQTIVQSGSSQLIDCNNLKFYYSM